MLTGLDHVVILVPDLAQASCAYAALGFTVVPGGRHSTGTENALISLRDGSYLELLAFATPNPSHRWWPLLQAGRGFADVCLASDSIVADCAAFERAGVAMAPPRRMSRTRPDGTEITWHLSIPLPPFANDLPFLIADETPTSLRIPPAGAHANAVVGVAALRWACADLAVATTRLRAITGRAPTPCAEPSIGGAGVAFQIGTLSLRLLAPTDPAGPIARATPASGAAPHSIVLHRADGVATRWGGARTCNAWIDVEPIKAG